MKAPTVGLLAIVAAACAAAWWLGRENRALRAELAKARHVARPAAASPAAPESQAVDTAGREEEGRESRASPADSAAAVEEAATRRALAELRDRWRDPAERARRFEAAVRRIERTHGRLFQRLASLAPEQREALKRKLAENELALADAVLPDDDDPLDAANGLARREAMAQAAAAGAAELRALLEPGDYEQLAEFEAARACRSTLAPVAESMRSAGVAVDEALEERMLTAYAAASRRATEQASRETAAVTATEREDQRRRQKEALQLELLRAMAGVLNEAQLSAFMQAQLESD